MSGSLGKREESSNGSGRWQVNKGRKVGRAGAQLTQDNVDGPTAGKGHALCSESSGKSLQGS